jgi:hypothetical protein
MDKDALRLISDFCRALGIRPEVRLIPLDSFLRDAEAEYGPYVSPDPPR